MDWANRFNLAGLTISYSTFQMAWEVIEKRDGYEVAFRWFHSIQRSEELVMGGFRKNTMGFFKYSKKFGISIFILSKLRSWKEWRKSISRTFELSEISKKLILGHILPV
jgi:hypothetical protein